MFYSIDDTNIVNTFRGINRIGIKVVNGIALFSYVQLATVLLIDGEE